MVRWLKIHGWSYSRPGGTLGASHPSSIEVKPQIPTGRRKEEEKSPHLDTILDPHWNDATSLRWPTVCRTASLFSAPAPRHRGHDTCQRPVSAGMSRHKCTLCGRIRQHAARVKGVTVRKRKEHFTHSSKLAAWTWRMPIHGLCSKGGEARDRRPAAQASHPPRLSPRPYIVDAAQAYCPSL